MPKFGTKPLSITPHCCLWKGSQGLWGDRDALQGSMAPPASFWARLRPSDPGQLSSSLLCPPTTVRAPICWAAASAPRSPAGPQPRVAGAGAPSAEVRCKAWADSGSLFSFLAPTGFWAQWEQKCSPVQSCGCHLGLDLLTSFPPSQWISV